MRRLARAFWNETNGVAAVEFALVVPVMLVFFLGTVEMSDAMLAKRRLTSMTSTVADLISRAKEIKDSDLDDVYTAALRIVAPDAPEEVSIRITSVEIQLDGDIEVGWSEGLHTEPYSPAQSIELPDGIGQPGGSIIMVESSYMHPNAVGFLNPVGPHEFDDVFYNQPRRTLKIARQ